MKQFFTITFLLACFSISSQETAFKADKEGSKFTIHTIKYVVSSQEELKAINWNDMKEIFKENKPEEINYLKNQSSEFKALIELIGDIEIDIIEDHFTALVSKVVYQFISFNNDSEYVYRCAQNISL